MFFAGAKRSQLRMPGNDTSWKPCVGGNGFVAGVAGDTAGVRMADDASHDENGGLQSERRGKLCEACSVVVNDGSRRDAMHKFLTAEPGERRGSKKGGRSRGNHFVYRDAALFAGGDHCKEVFVAFVGGGLAFQTSEAAQMPVESMQPCKTH